MYTEKQLVRVAKRENNTKRSYLVVNPLQAKHVPVSPSLALKMFRTLAKQLSDTYAGETLLLIGFAETATAIGAAVANELGCLYMQTTREQITGVDYLFFSEAHSHATEQKLVKNDMDIAAGKVERIIFIEDEVTTGNTIRNIIRILHAQYPQIQRYAVASLLNGMNEAAQRTYCERGIALHYLVKTAHDTYPVLANRFTDAGVYRQAMPHDADLSAVQILRVGGYMNARRLVSMPQYAAAVHELYETIASQLDFAANEKILVLGTEEFMYPSLYVASLLEKKGLQVACHATTRSPIVVYREKAYPLHCRYRLQSLYDENRTTYVYDLAQYEQVLIITDAQADDNAGIRSLVQALQANANEKIRIVRWTNI